jgi:hypothetical protein
MLFDFKSMTNFDADGGTGGTGDQPDQQQQGPTFESWYGSLDATTKQLIDDHTTGLRSALQKERDSSKMLEKQLRDAAKKLEAGSESEKQLTELANSLAAAQKQNAFNEEAHAAGVKNLRLAFLAASEAGLVDDKGNCDFTKLKAQFPELFVKVADGTAGSGTLTHPPAASMNDFIRRSAGRG